MPFTKITSGPNKGKYKSPSGKIWTADQVKRYYATGGKMKESRENLKFEFRPEFELKESKTGKWLTIGGVALVEGTSKNNNYYSVENLKENAGKEFKF